MIMYLTVGRWMKLHIRDTFGIALRDHLTALQRTSRINDLNFYPALHVISCVSMDQGNEPRLGNMVYTRKFTNEVKVQ